MKYLINEIESEKFDIIITLLEYETKITDYLKNVKIPSFRNKRVLIDAALCSGLNQYRFILSSFNDDGTIDLNQCKYVEVDKEKIDKADMFISKEPNYFRNSVLTKSQIYYFFNLMNKYN